MMKIAGSGSASGSTPKCHGSGTLDFTKYISAQDLYTLLLGEEQPACLAQLLLACCSSLQTADDEKTAVEKAIFCEDNLTFLLSMVQTAVNDSVAAAALR
jgi:hypothetical protein